MLFQSRKKHYGRRLVSFAFAAILGTAFLAAISNEVKSQCLNEFKPSPFKFTRNLATKKENSNTILKPTSPGELDPTFYNGGKITTDFSSSEAANSVALQPDGKIVAAGYFAGEADTDFAVFRYNWDGSLDTSFDTDGKLTTDFGGSYDSAYAVAVQTDGKIIAAGYRWTDGGTASFALVRYNTDGSLDASFGVGGKVVSAFGGSLIYDIAIQADGKIVAAGSSNNPETSSDFTLARYNLDGSLDTSFGAGGRVTTDFDNFYDEASGVALQSDGKIVAAGYRSDGCAYSDFALARYNTDGSLDPSFDTDGKVTTFFLGSDAAFDVAVQADGRAVAAGRSGPNAAAARYNTDGSLDMSFDADGKVTISFAGYAFGDSVALQGNGKIVISGGVGTDSYYDFALLRLNGDGWLDISFDSDGRVSTNFANVDSASDVIIQTDGKIVALGGSNLQSIADFALSRYGPDGSLDTSFDEDGRTTTSLFFASSTARGVALRENGGIVVAGSVGTGADSDFALACYENCSFYKVVTAFGNSDDAANAVATQADGKIIVAGYTTVGTNDRAFAVVRYTPDGLLDSSFGTDGKVVTNLGAFDDEIYSIAVQPDGKIIAAGHSSLDNELSYPMALVRYGADGSVDVTFGTGGKVIIQSVATAHAIAVQTNGKIVVAGYIPDFDFPFGFVSDFGTVRFNSNGGLDASFGTGGIARTHFGNSGNYAVARSIALQPDGKIVAAGYSRETSGGQPDFALVRHNADGSLDLSFDGDGKVRTLFDSSEGANAIEIQRNGKIIAAGKSDNNFAIARYNANGSPDTSFDTDGKLTTDFFTGADSGNAVAIQTNGKILAAGSAQNGDRNHFAVARYVGDPTRTGFDYDGDGRADVSVFRPSQFNASWFVFYSSSNYTEQLLPNFPADKIVPADYDGDGRTDIAQYNSNTGTWYLPLPGGYRAFRFGAQGDAPVPSDYDGDGKADVAIYRPSTGTWWILQSSDGAILIRRFGVAEDKPVPGDYDGDGQADIAVYRPSEGIWYLLQSTSGFGAARFGIGEDRPVAADYDGDGKTDIAVFRASTNVWYVLPTTNGDYFAFQFGLANDIPAPGDYDGDGKTDIAVFRSGVWYIAQSSNGAVRYHIYGVTGDIPTQSAFIP